MNYPELEKLDQLAKTSPLAKQRQLDEMLNSLRRCAILFDYVTEAKIRAISEACQEKGFGAYSVTRASEIIPEEFDKFPSFKALSIVLKRFQFNPNSSIESCTLCGSSGQLSVYKKKTGVNYCFACDCSNGNKYPSFQRWNQSLEKYFTRRSPFVISMDGKLNPYDADNKKY